LSDPVTIDRSVISWLIGAAGAFIFFLLSLGVKDIKDKMRKVDQLCIRLERLEQKVESELSK
jgi:hypothetical protein